VPVSVLDHDGVLCRVKTRGFYAFENDQAQSIAYFEPAEKPFTVALLLDTSASTTLSSRRDQRKRRLRSRNNCVRKDRVLIVSFNSEVLLLTEPTNNLGLIQDVIEVNAYTGTSNALCTTPLT
jgi:hypothetical protein